MLHKPISFWLELLRIRENVDSRVRLWNGYLGWQLPPRVKSEPDPKGDWPQLFVEPPAGGWPELTEEEMAAFEKLAEAHGGHPKLEHEYMNFSGHTFFHDVDLSGLILVRSNFTGTQFRGGLKLSGETHFYDQTCFDDVTFRGGIVF